VAFKCMSSAFNLCLRSRFVLSFQWKVWVFPLKFPFVEVAVVCPLLSVFFFFFSVLVFFLRVGGLFSSPPNFQSKSHSPFPSPGLGYDPLLYSRSYKELFYCILFPRR